WKERIDALENAYDWKKAKMWIDTYLAEDDIFSLQEDIRELDEKIAKKYGKSIENNPIFPNKTNVQFAQVLNEKNIKIEIFERGSGYTLASGSSACAAAATTFKKGLIKNEVEVLMQGGSLKVLIDDDFNVLQIGKVKKIFYGNFFISTFLDKFQN
ncbi:MAG: hypothetical protein WH035_04435, partial [Spirochaetota bacterium]